MRSIRWRLLATSWPSPTRRSSTARGRPAWSCLISRCPKDRGRSRFSMPPARIRAASTSSGSATANMSTCPPARRISNRTVRRRPILSDYRRSQSVEAGGSRALVAAGRTRRRQRGPAGAAQSPRRRLPRAQHQRLQQRPDRAYLGCIDGGVVILDIADKESEDCLQVEQLAALPRLHAYGPAPLRARPSRVTNELIKDAAGDWPSWYGLSMPAEENLVPISTCPLPPVEEFKNRGGRFGAHNIHENIPTPMSFQSEQIIFGTFFNGGLRAFDISNPYQPREIACFVPPAPEIAGRLDPAERCLRRRARYRLHGRSLCRRALHSRNGFLAATSVPLTTDFSATSCH